MAAEEFRGQISSIVTGTEQAINLQIEHIKFDFLDRDAKSRLVYDKSNLCEFHDDLMEDENTQFLYNSKNNQLYGACICNYQTYNKLLNVCWVNIECTYDDIPGLPPFLSKGRLLYAHILNTCFKRFFGNSFVLCNHAIDEAVRYHLTMGMHPYNDSPIQKIIPRYFLTDFIAYFDGGFYSEYLVDKKNTNQLRENPETCYLFYVSDPETRYDNIASIIHSLPLSARMGGKKTKRNKKRKKTKNKK